VEGSFTPLAPLASRYEALVKLRQNQSSPGPRVFQQEEYRPELNTAAATRVGYALDGNLSTLSIQEGKESTTWSLKDGLPTSSRRTVGPNVFVGQVLTQKSTLGVRAGLTHGMKPVPAAGSPWPLLEQRRGFQTQISGEPTPAPEKTPPARQLASVSHPAPLGQNLAYVSPPRAGARRAAVIWLGASLSFDVTERAWAAAPRNDDPSVRAFRDAGLVVMLPALRGAHGNPGRHECFFGEVDDVIAAGDYLASREDVDPARIYLGGHGAGGTLALLVAASSDHFAAVFAFGPAADVREYGISGSGGCLPEGASQKEVLLRAPAQFVSGIRSPTYVFEGGVNNSSAVLDVLRENASASVRFEIVPGADFQSLLAPGTQTIARAIAGAQVDDLHLRIDP
jgi:acetyl esterase/lipase